MRLFKQTIVINTELPRSGGKQRESPWTALWGAGLLGLGFVSMGILSLLGYNPPHSSGGGGGTILLGCLLLGPVLYYGLRSRIARSITRRLVPDWQLQERLNANPATLSRVMGQGDVRPRFIVDGKRYYAHSDFAEIALLLRASSAPVTTQEALLRPAAEVETAPELLLRPDETTQQNTTQQDGVSETQPSASRYQPVEEVERIQMNRPG